MANKSLSYDAEVYTLFNTLVIKMYKNAEQIRFLNELLPQYYPDKPTYISAVAWHEWNALKIMHSVGLAPKPLFCGNNYIVMAYAGKTIEHLQNTNHDLFRIAEQALKKMSEIGFKHNDLLPRNICVNKGRLVFIDFTMSEFNGISIIKNLPNPNWAYPGDERLLSYFRKE